MIITNVKDSPLKSKRFRAFLSDGQHIDFGLFYKYTIQLLIYFLIKSIDFDV